MAATFYQQALSIAQEIGDRHGEGNHLANMGLAHKQLRDEVKAREMLEKALAIYEAIEDPNAERVRGWLKGLGSRVVGRCAPPYDPAQGGPCPLDPQWECLIWWKKMSEPSVMTYTKLLRQPTAICSCCGKSQYPGTALVYTDNDSRVD